jgi:hypothetical protein
MACLLGNAVEHQRAAGDRFGMLMGIGKPDE